VFWRRWNTANLIASTNTAPSARRDGMRGEHSPEDDKMKYADKMGQELGNICYRLWHECVWLHWKWGEYVTLFGTTPDNVRLLNKAAPSFFRLVQDSLWDDVLLHICRLNDKPKSCGKENLTLQLLPRLVAPEIRARVEELLAACGRKCEFALDLRNRHLAHRDLALATNDKAKPLPPASRRSVKEAIEAIADVLKAVELHYMNVDVCFETVGCLGNAEALLCVLRDGTEVEEARRGNGSMLGREGRHGRSEDQD
jgi:hypothetical protein